MEDNVPLEVKQQRLYALQDKINGYCNLNNQKWVGKTVKVLVDGPSRKNDQVFSGYTEHNKLVNFTAENVQPGDIIDVKITEHRSWTLRGEMVK
jgi:tRNA-2-methylthio-N6-dimethylallyladenosine synthase